MCLKWLNKIHFLILKKCGLKLNILLWQKWSSGGRQSARRFIQKSRTVKRVFQMGQIEETVHSTCIKRHVLKEKIRKGIILRLSSLLRQETWRSYLKMSFIAHSFRSSAQSHLIILLQLQSTIGRTFFSSLHLITVIFSVLKSNSSLIRRAGKPGNRAQKHPHVSVCSNWGGFVCVCACVCVPVCVWGGMLTETV